MHTHSQDMMEKLPSTRDGLGLGAITEDPREDMTSEFTVSRKSQLLAYTRYSLLRLVCLPRVTTASELVNVRGIFSG